MSNVQFRFSCRSDDVEEKLFAELKESGLESVFLGLESGIDADLRRFGKGVSACRNQEAIEVLERLGIKIMPGFISINPWTSLEDLQENLRFIQDAKISGLTSLLLRRFRVYSGTILEAKLLSEGIVHGDYRWYKHEVADERVREIVRALTLYANSFGGAKQTSSDSDSTLWVAAGHLFFWKKLISWIESAKTIEDCQVIREAAERRWGESYV